MLATAYKPLAAGPTKAKIMIRLASFVNHHDMALGINGKLYLIISRIFTMLKYFILKKHDIFPKMIMNTIPATPDMIAEIRYPSNPK